MDALLLVGTCVVRTVCGVAARQWHRGRWYARDAMGVVGAGVWMALVLCMGVYDMLLYDITYTGSRTDEEATGRLTGGGQRATPHPAVQLYPATLPSFSCILIGVLHCVVPAASCACAFSLACVWWGCWAAALVVAAHPQMLQWPWISLSTTAE